MPNRNNISRMHDEINSLKKSHSKRILSTPSVYAKKHYLYAQEVGTLTSVEPHISQRQNLSSYLFFVVTDGEGTLTYNDKTCTITAGDCVWVDCRKPYAHESSLHNPWTLKWIHFNGEEVPFYYSLYLEQGYTNIFTPRNISLFTDTIQELYQIQELQELYTELKTHKCITDLITLCFTENKVLDTDENSIYTKLQQVRNYIEVHSDEKITLDTLSEQFFISKYHLSREFHKEFGITIGSFITAKRISHAKSILRFSSSSVEEVALTCGFQDAGYFIKVFKNSEGMTPLEYRRKW